jgi:pyruvate,orthophosphate dikinase
LIFAWIGRNFGIFLLQAAEGVLTTLGGLTSHAAVVMRGMGKSAVTGARDLMVDVHKQQLKSRDGKTVLKKGDVISIDGSTGFVYLGEVPTVSSGHSADFQTILSWADKYKDMYVFANADTPEEAMKAIELGADGIGLCRTEHMFFHPDRLSIFRQLLLTESQKDRDECLQKLSAMQQEDFEKMFSVMNGRQVTIRLVDPPIHEFMPDPSSSDFPREVEKIASSTGIDIDLCKTRILELQERNPMMGCRGARLEIMHPELVCVQVKAIVG